MSDYWGVFFVSFFPSFNRIDIPPYENYEKLYEKLLTAIEETCGFAVEWHPRQWWDFHMHLSVRAFSCRGSSSAWNIQDVFPLLSRGKARGNGWLGNIEETSHLVFAVRLSAAKLIPEKLKDWWLFMFWTVSSILDRISDWKDYYRKYYLGISLKPIYSLLIINIPMHHDIDCSIRYNNLLLSWLDMP